MWKITCFFGYRMFAGLPCRFDDWCCDSANSAFESWFPTSSNRVSSLGCGGCEKDVQVTKVNTKTVETTICRESWKSMLGESSLIIYPVNMFDVEGRPNSKFKQPQFPALYSSLVVSFSRFVSTVFSSLPMWHLFKNTKMVHNSKNRENPIRNSDQSFERPSSRKRKEQKNQVLDLFSWPFCSNPSLKPLRKMPQHNDSVENLLL